MLKRSSMKYIVAGVIAGAALSQSIVHAEPIKEYILKIASYPVLVNQAEYKNDQLPVLNYEGNTYVPLKAVGDLLGVKVQWNDELKRAEIQHGNGTDAAIELAPLTASVLNGTDQELHQYFAALEKWTLQTAFKTVTEPKIDLKGKEAIISKLTDAYTREEAEDMFHYFFKASGDQFEPIATDYFNIGRLNKDLKVKKEVQGDTLLITISGAHEASAAGETLIWGPYIKTIKINKDTLKITDQDPKLFGL